MSAKRLPAAALLCLALPASAQQVTIPLGKAPRQVERPIAPIEQVGPLFAAACKDWDEWDKPAPPIRIFGNTYYVGTCGISAILVTGKDGHVLIDGATEAAADGIAANIRRLGFRLTDVKVILHSHEHIDHGGGIARLQRLTGAEFYASRIAARVFNSGVATDDDPQQGMHPPLPVARVTRTVVNGEQVRVGDVILVAIATPGHTGGAMSWRWASCDGGVCRQTVYADSLTAVSRDDYKFSAHPDRLAAFRTSLGKIGGADCDILLTPHPSSSDMIARLSGRAAISDPAACAAFAKTMGARLDERLAKEKAAK